MKKNSSMSEVMRTFHKENPRPKEYYQTLGKISHAKSPRTKEYFSSIGKIGGRPKKLDKSLDV